MIVVRAVSGLLAVVVAAVAVPLVVASFGLSSLTDDGRAGLPTIFAGTADRAVVVGEVDLEADLTGMRLGDVDVGASGADLFVGVGDSRAVEIFLDSGAPPTAVGFWRSQSVGDDPAISFDPTVGRWSVVVMNADGSPGVTTDLDISIPAGPVRLASAAVMGAGLLAAGASALLFLVAFRHPSPADQAHAGVPSAV